MIIEYDVPSPLSNTQNQFNSMLKYFFLILDDRHLFWKFELKSIQGLILSLKKKSM